MPEGSPLVVQRAIGRYALRALCHGMDGTPRLWNPRLCCDTERRGRAGIALGDHVPPVDRTPATTSRSCISEVHTSRIYVMKSRILTPVLAVALLTLAACGGERASSGTAPTDVDVEVRAVDGILWDAEAYTATAVDGVITIFVANDSALPHNMQVKDMDGKDVGKLVDIVSPGSSDTVELSIAPGDYRIVCEIPGHTNMDSSLTVS